MLPITGTSVENLVASVGSDDEIERECAMTILKEHRVTFWGFRSVLLFLAKFSAGICEELQPLHFQNFPTPLSISNQSVLLLPPKFSLLSSSLIFFSSLFFWKTKEGGAGRTTCSVSGCPQRSHHIVACLFASRHHNRPHWPNVPSLKY